MKHSICSFTDLPSKFYTKCQISTKLSSACPHLAFWLITKLKCAIIQWKNNDTKDYSEQWEFLNSQLGTCESFFCIRIKSRIESAVRFDFESNFWIESAVYTTQAVTPSNELQGAPCRRTVYLSRTRVMHATEYLLFISIQS